MAAAPQLPEADRLETVCVSTPLEFAQAALLLGEQRAWDEGLAGRDLAEIQPSAAASTRIWRTSTTGPRASC